MNSYLEKIKFSDPNFVNEFFLKIIKIPDWESVPDLKKELKRYQVIAKNSLKKDKRINIRLASKDLMDLQAKAMQEGLPYQTLISSVLHKYVTGQLKSASE